MLSIGLCSVTFRNKSVDEIIDIAYKNKLNFIEWGADIHLKPGDYENAKYIKNKCEKLGINCSYGSYFKYRENDDFMLNIMTAKALGVKDIRIWATDIPSKDVDKNVYKTFIEQTIKISNISEKYGININFEDHRKTLTDTTESAKKLLNDINKDNVLMYWQPQAGETVNERLESIEALKNKLNTVHVFNWDDQFNRYPLEEATEEWSLYVDKLGRDRTYLLEFIKDDDLEQFEKDARALKKILGGKDGSRDIII